MKPETLRQMAQEMLPWLEIPTTPASVAAMIAVLKWDKEPEESEEEKRAQKEKRERARQQMRNAVLVELTRLGGEQRP